MAGAATPQAAKEYGSITGTVSFGQAGISRVFVYVRDGWKGGKSDRSLATDSSGGFKISGLPAGLYDVFFSKPAFLPVCQRVEILSGKNIEIPIKFEPDRGASRKQSLERTDYL